MAEARSNLERCETVVLKVRFDGMVPLSVNDLRSMVGTFKQTNDPVGLDRHRRRVEDGSFAWLIAGRVIE